MLARPGWAGSGVAPESWWRRAVFYRIDPARFQDSDGDGKGDLPGIAQRMDYLQSVGIDALLLDGSFDPAGLDDVIHEASRHHIRVLVSVRPEAESGSRVSLLANVRSWMSSGAAGVSLPKPEGSGASYVNYPELVALLRSIVQSFPGDRVLLTEPVALPSGPAAAPRPARGRHRAETAAPVGEAHGSLLVAGPALPVTAADPAAIRQALAGASESTDPGSTPLLRLTQDPATGSPVAAAVATLLLGSRGAVVFSAGDEIGLNLSASGAASADSPAMQWTPSNHTAAQIERTDGSTPAKPASETEFGAYHPYIPPPPGSLTGPNPAPPRASVDANIPAALPDPDTLPGFTSGAAPTPAPDAAKRNVIVQDRDPKSLLNAYRQLIGIHHGNATLRNGTQSMINRDAQGAVVWVRRAPAGSRTVANVVAAVNLSDKPVTLALDSDIEELGMRGGALRPLFVSASAALTGESTAHLSLPPYAAFIGEIYHAGLVRPEAAPERHRRSRHRVRR